MRLSKRASRARRTIRYRSPVVRSLVSPAPPCGPWPTRPPRPLSLAFELIRAALQEQHPEDVLLELGGIHLPAKDVCGREQMPLELGEGELAHGKGIGPRIIGPTA